MQSGQLRRIAAQREVLQRIGLTFLNVGNRTAVTAYNFMDQKAGVSA